MFRALHAITVAVLISSMAYASTAHEPVVDDSLSYIWDSYMAYNATEAIADSAFLHWEEPECNSHFRQSFLLQEELTTHEQYLIGTFLIAENKEMGASPSIRRAIEYAERTGSLPVNGLELLKLYDEYLLTADGFNLWAAADPQQKLAMIRRAINPATGKVYATFEAAEWVAYGIYIEKLEGDKGVMALPFQATTSQGESIDEMRAYQGWRIVVYGEQPGSVLIDKPIWREISSQGPLTTGCRCKPKAAGTAADNAA